MKRFALITVMVLSARAFSQDYTGHYTCNHSDNIIVAVDDITITKPAALEGLYHVRVVEDFKRIDAHLHPIFGGIPAVISDIYEMKGITGLTLVGFAENFTLTFDGNKGPWVHADWYSNGNPGDLCTRVSTF